MLKLLNIQNLAIAENNNIHFYPGLNVITGETGAGKSLIVDALCLLRGSKVETSLIRTGHESAQVTGVFIPQSKNKFIFKLLEEIGIPLYSDNPEEIVIKRFIHRNGKHKASINENIVSTKTLQIFARELIDISSQYENQRLLEVEAHTSFLDEFSKTTTLYKKYIEIFEKTYEVLKKVQTLSKEIELLKREKNLYEFEYSQITEAHISETELKELEEVLIKEKNSKNSQIACSQILELLQDSDVNAINIIKQCKKQVDRIVRNSNSKNISLNTEDLDTIIALLEDYIKKIETTSNNFNIDEKVVLQAHNRMEVYHRILQKYGPTIHDVENYSVKCKKFLSETNELEIKLEQELQNLEKLIDRSLMLSEELSNMRLKKINFISIRVEKELAELGMQKAKFICKLIKNNSEKIKINFSNNLYKNFEEKFKLFSELNKHGKEKAQFLLSTNVGLEPQPIEKVASGGELSRVMLAIKNVLFGSDCMSLFVFDEIDSGVSGNIAAKVGRKLLDFCNNSFGESKRQVLCITHLPQVASFAQNHFIVEKIMIDSITKTKISLASDSERISQIAFLLSGEEVSPQSLAQAQFLLQQAQKNASF